MSREQLSDVYRQRLIRVCFPSCSAALSFVDNFAKWLIKSAEVVYSLIARFEIAEHVEVGSRAFNESFSDLVVDICTWRVIFYDVACFEMMRVI